MEEDESSRRLKQMVECAICAITRLNECLISIEQTEQRFARDPTHVTIDAQKLEAEVRKQYRQGIERIQSVLNYEMTTPDIPVGTPTTDADLHNLLRKYFLEEIKTKGTPTPSSCGCWARKVTEYRPGNIICARSDGKFRLMIVKEWTPQLILAYDMSDSTATDGNYKVCELQPEDTTLLPTMIPRKPVARWEHTTRSTVLALPIERDMKSWPTIFEQAIVVSRPCDGHYDEGTGAREKRGYLLEFIEGPDTVRRVVPEQFVAYYRENWQKA